MPIIYNAATTLNGFLADDHDSLQWLFDVPGADDAEADNQAFLASVDALVMGSTTYEWLLDALDSPAELTAQYGDWPIWVVTSRDLPVPDGSRVRLVGGAVAEALPAIRATGDTIWVMGGGDLAGQFHDVGALDGIILTLAPVFLPAGRPTLPRRIEAHRLSVPQVRRLGHFTELRFEVLPG